MSLQSIPLPPLPSSAGRLAAIHPLPGKTADSTPGAASTDTDFSLLAVNDRAELLRFSPLRSEVEVLAVLDIPDLDSSKPIQLVTSPKGDYAAVSNRFGRYAAVFVLPDLQGQSARLLSRLDRGDYHFDTCTFPLAFTEPEGQLVLVHGSDWNRLELTQIPSLQPLADRPKPDPYAESTESAEALPRLNYFHGKLRVSPDGARIADSGWVWQPVGLIAAWSLREWLSRPWESENGKSLTRFFQTEDWDLPIAWVDEHRLAIWGRIDTDLLDEEDWAEVGDQQTIVIYDSRTGLISRAIREVPAYLNSLTLIPKMDVFPHLLADMAFADERLFIWGHSVPLHVWSLSDPGNESLEQLTEFAFNQALYHPSAKLFIDLQADGNLQAYRCLQGRKNRNRS